MNNWSLEAIFNCTPVSVPRIMLHTYRKQIVLAPDPAQKSFILSYSSLHNRRFRRQARRTQHFARSAKRVGSVLLHSSRASHSFRTSRKIPRSPRLAHKAPVMQATPIPTHHNKSCRVKDRGRVNLRSQRIIIPPAGYFTKNMLQND